LFPVGAGTVMAFIAVLTVVPLLGSTPLGRRTVAKTLTDETDAESKRRPLRWHGQLVRFSVRYHVPVFVGSFILTVICIWSAQYLPVDIKLHRVIAWRLNAESSITSTRIGATALTACSSGARCA
jgi:uncharacterized membrane protein YdfJ with MMPL/SSD domain